MNVSEFKDKIWDYTRLISENSNQVFSPIVEQYGLTMLQVRILLELHRNDWHSIGSLADSINIAGANISAMCKKLENKGLLERVRDQSDERVVKVTITQKGSQTVSEIEQRLNEKFLQIINSETEENLRDIVIGMEKLNNLLVKIQSLDKSIKPN